MGMQGDGTAQDLSDLDAGIVVITERDLYAIIGELFVKSQIMGGQLGQLRAQLASLTVVESPSEEDGNADGES